MNQKADVYLVDNSKEIKSLRSQLGRTIEENKTN